MFKCSVPGCTSTSQLVRFPRNKNIFTKWLLAIKNPILTKLQYGAVYKNKRICMEHFEDKYIKEESTMVYKLLLPEAVPTLNLPGQPSRIKCLAYLNSDETINATSSFIDKSFSKLIAAEVLNLISIDRTCVLIFTKIPLKPHLQYNHQRDMILGWQNCPGVPQKLYADHALVFMVRGLYSNWIQTISFVFTEKDTHSDVLIQTIKHVISTLFLLRLKVVATVCEPTESNVRAMKELKLASHKKCLHSEDELGYENFFLNTREIIILYDIPCLLKNVRNCLSTQDINFCIDGNRYLATWRHLTEYFRENPSEFDKHGLTYNDLIPSKLKNNLQSCGRVFSLELASDILEFSSKNNRNLQATGKLLFFFNELFDSFNGVDRKTPIKKPLHKIVTSVTNHWEAWCKSLEVLSTMKVVEEDGYETQPSCVTYWLSTVHGIKHLWHCVLQRSKFKSFTPKFLQIQPLNKILTDLSYNSKYSIHLNREKKGKNLLNCSEFVKSFENAIVNFPETRLELCDATRPLFRSICKRFFEKVVSIEDLRTLHLNPIIKSRTLLTASQFDDVIYKSILYFKNESEYASVYQTFPLVETFKYLAKKIYDTQMFVQCSNCESTFFGQNYSPKTSSFLTLAESNFCKAFLLVAEHVNKMLQVMYNKPNIMEDLRASVNANVDIKFLNNTCHIWDKLFVGVCVQYMVLVWIWKLNRYLSGKETIMHSNMSQFSKQAILVNMKRKDVHRRCNNSTISLVSKRKIKIFSNRF